MTEHQFAKNPDLLVEDRDTEVLLYEAGAHRAIYLNDTAALVWKLCNGTRTVQDLIDLLSENYPDARADLPREIEQTVEMLLGDGALL
jgi:pyrroloquinoline quinone biosynthesis protein D